VGKLEGLNTRQGSTLIDYMKEGWSGSEFGRTLASGKGVILPQDSYRFARVINTQPKRAGVLFSEEAMVGGLQGRFLWFDVTAGTKRDLVTYEDVEVFEVFYINLTGVKHIRALESMDMAHEQHHWDTHDGKATEPESHLLLTRAKVAVALAVLDGRVELNVEDWQLSEVVIEHTKKTREAIEEEYQSATVLDGKRGAVKKAMSEAAQNTMHVQSAPAAILRQREKHGKWNSGKSGLSQNQRKFKGGG